MENIHWTDDYIDLHLKTGTVFLERPIDGVVTTAYFEGEATVSFRPPDRRSEESLEFWFGEKALEDLELDHLLLFRLGDESLADLLGVEGDPTEPLPDLSRYESSKSALGQLGMTLTHCFMNRSGRSRDTSYLVLPVEKFRTKGSQDALLLYSMDPNRDIEVQLDGFGHREITEQMPHKYYFHSLVETHSVKPRFRPHARVTEYSTDLKVGTGKFSSESATTVHLTPDPGTAALKFDFTPRMKVLSVTGPDGAALPFLQWQYLRNNPNYDATIVVDVTTLESDQSQEITVTSAGSLFEPWFTVHWLAEEDTWYPSLDDPEGALFELFFTVPRNREVVGTGRLLEEKEVGKGHRYHFRTQRLHKSSTMYFGDFVSKSIEADETTIEAYVARTDTGGRQHMKFVLNELSNMVKVYNRMYLPLETEILRVAATPTSHGRGFEGLILLGQNGGFGSAAAGSDLFRAHEVAHQWWGNVVQQKDWPADRWISESFAEYSAMEYFKHRHENPARAKTVLYENWVFPIFNTAEFSRKTLNGEELKKHAAEYFPIASGGDNVYTKGPLLLHMLRYLFSLQAGDDEAFWGMLRDFLESNRYARVSTADFIKTAESHLGSKIDWFWKQWLYGTEIPTVKWTHRVEPVDGKFLLTVEARQEDSDFVLYVPVYLHFKGNRTMTRPLKVDGDGGTLQLKLPEAPQSVTLNDNWEALIHLDRM